MLSQALPSRARLLLPYVRSAHHGHVFGLRTLNSHASAAAVDPAYGEHRRHRDGEGKAVKVAVWWDFQMCRIPPGIGPFRLVPRVTAALRAAGIRGPVEINAFGDVSVLPRDDQEALSDTGVTFTHVPCSGKGNCDRSLMADLIYWIAQNPPPAHFFLISGDKEFANILHRLRMSNYNILLSCPEVGSKTLRSAATIMWPWEDLVKKSDLTPKHVNPPPDGSSSSWYGHCRGPVDIQLLKSKDLKALPRDTKIPQPQVPKSIINGIKKVLRFYPEGISLPNLRAELRRANVSLDKRSLRFKRFSALLQAMPDVVEFIDPLPGDNQPAVVGVFKRSSEPSEQEFDRMNYNRSSIKEKHLSETESEELSSWVSQPSSSEASSCTRKETQEANVSSPPSDQLSSGRSSPDLTTKAEPNSYHVGTDISLATDVPSSDALSREQRKAQSVDLVTQTESQISHTEADIVATAGTPMSGEQGDVGKKGILKRILSIWNGAR